MTIWIIIIIKINKIKNNIFIKKMINKTKKKKEENEVKEQEQQRPIHPSFDPLIIRYYFYVN